jgi:hypothetical protein
MAYLGFVGAGIPGIAATTGQGVTTVADWGALPAATGSGAQRLVLDRGQVFTDVTVEDVSLWLPDRAIRDAAGALRTLTWSRDTGGEKCRLRPGDTVPAGWTLGGGSTAGSISTAGGKVSLTGYLYTDVADSDAALTILVMQLHSASAFANTSANNNIGVFAGNNNAGNAMVGLRVRGTSSTPPLDVGYYNNSIGKGRALAKVGEPSFALIDWSSGGLALADGIGTPSDSIVGPQSLFSAGQRWCEAVSIDEGGTDRLLELDLFGQIKVV